MCCATKRYFVVGIGLLLSLVGHSVFAQSGDCEGMPVRFPHADLNSPTPRQLTLANCIPDACLSRTTVKKTTLQLRWGLDETYAGTSAAFSSQVDVTVTGYAADDTPLTSQEASLQINQDQPEQYYRIDVYEPVRYFSIEPKNYQADPSIATHVRLDASYRVTTETDVAGLSVSGLSETVSGWEAQLRWQTGTCPAPSYEVQIVRLYDNANPTADTWRTALSVLTDQRTPSLSLTLAEGSGGYAWRVRPLGTLGGGASNPANWGGWSSERQFTFRQPDEEKNWIYSRTFTEGGKLREQLTLRQRPATGSAAADPLAAEQTSDRQPDGAGLRRTQRANHPAYSYQGQANPGLRTATPDPYQRNYSVRRPRL